MKLSLVFTVAVLALGCGAGATSNPNVIATYQGGVTKDLQSCTLEFWWETVQLQRFCGEPKWKLTWLGRKSGAECWVYANEAAGGAYYTAVCLEPDGGRLRVKNAIGLRTAPDGSGPMSAPTVPASVTAPIAPPPPPPPPPADPNAPPPPEPN